MNLYCCMSSSFYAEEGVATIYVLVDNRRSEHREGGGFVVDKLIEPSHSFGGREQK